MTRLLAAIRKRPVRVVEALLVLLGSFGVVLAPDQAAAILTAVALLVGASEAAQTQTTPLADPHDATGVPLVPVTSVAVGRNTFTDPVNPAMFTEHGSGEGDD